MLSFLDRQIKMDTAEDAESVANEIEACNELKTLELRGNTIGVEAGKRLARALENHPELERAGRISFYQFTGNVVCDCSSDRYLKLCNLFARIHSYMDSILYVISTKTTIEVAGKCRSDRSGSLRMNMLSVHLLELDKIPIHLPEVANVETMKCSVEQGIVQGVEKVADALVNLRCLWSDLFTGRLKTEIPLILRTLCSAVISANCHITELDLSDNAFGPIGAEGISQFLASPSAYSLQILKLNNNGLGAGGQTIAQSLLKCHRNALKDGAKFKLKTFIAGRNRLEDLGAKALAEAFSVLGSLEEINIAQNGIREEGICALARCFQLNLSLRVINLSDNTCNIDGALELAEAIHRLRELEVLDLGDSLCRDDGVIGISEIISDSKHRKLKVSSLREVVSCFF
uniref:RAN GTPase-activating protein 2 n=1 Tax=Angiostrongylus cantonensis TaxID=6313 RepID=A0A0K0DI43_ANGCA